MNKEEYDKLSTFDKIDYDIAMKLYDEHNSKIASINDHLGDIFDYRDLQDAKECELQDEMRMYRDALKEKCDVIDKAIEYINENWGHWCSNHCKYATETINILKGDNK